MYTPPNKESMPTNHRLPVPASPPVQAQIKNMLKLRNSGYWIGDKFAALQ